MTTRECRTPPRQRSSAQPTSAAGTPAQTRREGSNFSTPSGSQPQQQQQNRRRFWGHSTPPMSQNCFVEPTPFHERLRAMFDCTMLRHQYYEEQGHVSLCTPNGKRRGTFSQYSSPPNGHYQNSRQGQIFRTPESCDSSFESQHDSTFDRSMDTTAPQDEPLLPKLIPPEHLITAVAVHLHALCACNDNEGQTFRPSQPSTPAPEGSPPPEGRGAPPTSVQSTPRRSRSYMRMSAEDVASVNASPPPQPPHDCMNSSHNEQASFRPSFFHSIAVPAISIRDYLKRLVRHCRLDYDALIVLVVLFHRFVGFYQKAQDEDSESGFPQLSDVPCPRSVHRLLLLCAILTVKSREDEYFSNNFYSQVGGIPLDELNLLESMFLEAIQWNVYVSTRDYNTVLKCVLLPAYCRARMGESITYVYTQTRHGTFMSSRCSSSLYLTPTKRLTPSKDYGGRHQPQQQRSSCVTSTLAMLQIHNGNHTTRGDVHNHSLAPSDAPFSGTATPRTQTTSAVNTIKAERVDPHTVEPFRGAGSNEGDYRKLDMQVGSTTNAEPNHQSSRAPPTTKSTKRKFPSPDVNLEPLQERQQMQEKEASAHSKHMMVLQHTTAHYGNYSTHPDDATQHCENCVGGGGRTAVTVGTGNTVVGGVGQAAPMSDHSLSMSGYSDATVEQPGSGSVAKALFSS